MTLLVSRASYCSTYIAAWQAALNASARHSILISPAHHACPGPGTAWLAEQRLSACVHQPCMVVTAARKQGHPEPGPFYRYQADSLSAGHSSCLLCT